jgi:hypothetical protein
MLEAISILLMLIFLVLPVITAIRLMVKRKTSFWAWIAWLFISSIGCYLLLLLSVYLTDLRLDIKLNSYDLNGDGSFSGAELTPEMEHAMSEWSTDTGRGLAPSAGVVLIPFYTGFWYLLLGIPYMIVCWNDRMFDKGTRV